MVQNLKDFASDASDPWSEYNSEKKDENNNGWPSSSVQTLFTDICSPNKEAKIGENLNI